MSGRFLHFFLSFVDIWMMLLQVIYVNVGRRLCNCNLNISRLPLVEMAKLSNRHHYSFKKQFFSSFPWAKSFFFFMSINCNASLIAELKYVSRWCWIFRKEKRIKKVITSRPFHKISTIDIHLFQNCVM